MFKAGDERVLSTSVVPGRTPGWVAALEAWVLVSLVPGPFNVALPCRAPSFSDAPKHLDKPENITAA